MGLKFKCGRWRGFALVGVAILVPFQFQFPLDFEDKAVVTFRVQEEDSHRETKKGPITDTRYALCSRFTTPSTAFLWKQLKDQTLKASYFPGTLADQERFQEWVDQLYSFYTPERLRRSISSRASTSAMRRIVQILSDYPTTMEPLRILVSGGSVAAGNNCGATPPGIPGGKSGNVQWEPCSWPGRLEHLWNHMFFGGEKFVQVTNMAAGGASSDVATLVLEYQLLPKGHPLPHIILLDHSPNDAQHANVDNELFYKHMQDIVQAAHKMRLCDADLPLVVLVDDFYGFTQPNVVMEQTSRFYSIASWFNLMSISYGNIVRHEIHSRYVNATLSDPLMGSNFNLHMGMGFHIGMSWAVMYNFLNEIVETCYEDQYHGGLETSQGAEDWWPNKTGGLLELEQMKSRGVPSKHIGNLRRESSPFSVVSEWKDRVREKEIRCQNVNASSGDSGRVCEYAWMSTRAAGISWPRDIDREMQDILIYKDGWVAKGKMIQQPRTGWYADQENATFSLKIPVSNVETSYFTVVIMQSYGPNFRGTNLVLNVRVQHASGGEDDQASYEVSGYHEIRTSVHVPHKFPMPGDGAKVNDTIIFDATLTTGSYFKIAGLAFCKF
jgi:hypothetical protein